MKAIAWILADTCVYWKDIVGILAVLAAVCCFLALYLPEGSLKGAVLFVPLAVVSSLMLARLSHWYFHPEQYESLLAALRDLGRGGFALMGAFSGCLLAACFLGLTGLERDLPHMLDCISLAGALGIGLGRLASFFDDSGRGMVLPAGCAWAGAVPDPVSGISQWRLNTFALQAAAAGLLFLGLLLWYLSEKKWQARKAGDVALVFALCYGASQVLLDSTRYDGLKLRSNGFVSPVQILGAAAMAVAVLIFAVRLVRAGGWKKWQVPLWLSQAGCFGLAGYMEYYVQRHSGHWAWAYSLMGGALLLLILLTLLTRQLAESARKTHRAWLEQLRVNGKEDSSWKP